MKRLIFCMLLVFVVGCVHTHNIPKEPELEGFTGYDLGDAVLLPMNEFEKIMNNARKMKVDNDTLRKELEKK